MKSSIITCLSLFVFLLVSCETKPQFDLAIENVQVFDPKTKTVTPNQTILIQNDTITLVTNTSENYSAKQKIEGKGRLLSPGFIDTHVHLVGNYGTNAAGPETYSADNGLEMLRDLTRHHYLNYGVTTLIEMGQPEEWMDITLDWQKQPKPNYPDLFICGGSIVSDEDRRQPAHHIEVMNPEDGRQKVRDYAAKGLKYMKFYRKLRKPDYEAMVDEAKIQGIIVNSHVDNNVVTISEAMDYGVRNFEHFFTLTPSILDYDTHWPLMNEMYDVRMSPSIDEYAAQMTYFFGYIKAHPEYEARLLALFDDMATKNATLSTAINVLASGASQTDFFTSFEYYPIRDTPMVNYSEDQQQQLDEAFKAMMTYAKIAHDKGVKLRIGTDCRNGGRAFLSELLLMTQHGFTMEEALQIATLNGYESMNLDDHRGRIAVGMKADLILFEENPFEDANHLLSDKIIIKDGVVLESKPSIAYDFQDIIVDKGIQAATAFLKTAEADNTYAPLQISEFRQVVKQLIEGGKIEEGIGALELFKSKFPDKEVMFDNVQLTNLAYGLVSDANDPLLKKFMAFWDSYYPEEKQYIGLLMYLTLEDKGVEAAKAQFKAIKDDDNYVLDEGEINGVGYLYLLDTKELDKAKAIFEMNVDAFPESWGVYDSLAEYYMVAGDKVKSRALYQKSLEINPENTNGKQMLKRL